MTNQQKEFKELLDQTIKSNNLYGRSFTYGVALYSLVAAGVIENDQLDELLLEAAASTLDISYQTASDKLTMRACVEIIDLSDLQAIAEELAGEGEE